MPGATIIYIDIVGFSDKSTVLQRRLVTSLNQAMRPLLSANQHGSVERPSQICLPTGDGMAIVLIHSGYVQRDPSEVFNLIYIAQSWASKENRPARKVELRVGIHMGIVEYVTDCNRRLNVCGDAINRAQRVMDSANPRQVLFSDEAFNYYIGAESRKYVEPPFSYDLEASFEGPIDVYVKHRRRILVYKMVVKPDQGWWCNDDPTSKNVMVVGLTPLPKKIEGTFANELKRSKRIALVQLTGERLLDAFSSRQLSLSPDIKRFWVFTPDPEWYPTSYLGHGRPTKSKLHKFVERWKDLLLALRGEHRFIDLKLGLFQHPPLIGASYFDWEIPGDGKQTGGRIHVSPYIWGVYSAECPGYELEWIGKEPHPVYRTYVDGLNYLNANTSNVLPED